MKTILLLTICLTAFSTAQAEKHSFWKDYNDRKYQQEMLDYQKEQVEIMRNQMQMEQLEQMNNNDVHINTPYENEMLRQLIERGYYE